MRRLLAVTILMALMVPNRVLAAQSGFDLVLANCPTRAATLKKAQDQRTEDVALNENAQYADYRTLARLYYLCSLNNRGTFGSDIAVYGYATSLAEEADCSVQRAACMENQDAASQALDALASATQFPYIRKLAIAARDSMRAMVSHLEHSP